MIEMRNSGFLAGRGEYVELRPSYAVVLLMLASLRLHLLFALSPPLREKH